MAVNVQETRLGIVSSKNAQKIVNGVHGVNVVLHVDQKNKAEKFWLKQQMAVNVQETRLGIVPSKNVHGVQSSSQINQSVGGASGHPGQHVPLLVGQNYKQDINMVGQVALDIKKDTVIRRGTVPMKVKEKFYSTTY